MRAGQRSGMSVGETGRRGETVVKKHADELVDGLTRVHVTVTTRSSSRHT